MNVRARYIAALVVTVALAYSCSARAELPRVEPFVTFSHDSNLFIGEPFHSNPAGREPTLDYLAPGVTFVWPRVEVDLSHGVASKSCRRGDCWGDPATRVSVRYYPWRKR